MALDNLERIVTKVIDQVEHDLIAQIESSYSQSIERLRSSRASIELEYNKIVENDEGSRQRTLSGQIVEM